MYIFVASFHALTSARDPAALRANIRQMVIDYLAFGLDPERTSIYLQHDVPEVTELAWMLSCVCPEGWMDKMVSYKDKVQHGLTANVGLYTYPILQAADILAVDADLVPVGKDQVQHVEITRDLAQRFNQEFQSEVFKLPAHRMAPDAAVLPGIDGEKMSKSYGNGIDPFHGGEAASQADHEHQDRLQGRRRAEGSGGELHLPDLPRHRGEGRSAHGRARGSLPRARHGLRPREAGALRSLRWTTSGPRAPGGSS